MKINSILTILIIYIISSCYLSEKEDIVVFDYYYGNNLRMPHDSVVLTYKPFDDSISLVTIKNKQPLYVYESSDGIFTSINNKKFSKSFSFLDTLKHENLGYPFDSLTSTSLIMSKVYSVEGTNITVYCFNEEVGNNLYNKSHAGSVTYYTPNIGVLIYYTGEKPDGAYMRRFSQNAIGGKLITKIKTDTSFYAEHLMKNPIIETIKFLPKEHFK